MVLTSFWASFLVAWNHSTQRRRKVAQYESMIPRAENLSPKRGWKGQSLFSFALRTAWKPHRSSFSPWSRTKHPRWLRWSKQMNSNSWLYTENYISLWHFVGFVAFYSLSFAMAGTSFWRQENLRSWTKVLGFLYSLMWKISNEILTRSLDSWNLLLPRPKKIYIHIMLHIRNSYRYVFVNIYSTYNPNS